MKFIKKSYRNILSTLLILTIFMSIFSTVPVHANMDLNQLLGNPVLDEMGELTTPRWLKWKIAIDKDKFFWGEFHREVQNDIKKSWGGDSDSLRLEYPIIFENNKTEESKNQSTSNKGKTGRADVALIKVEETKETNEANETDETKKTVYIWEIKPESYSKFPKRQLALNQLDKYIKADPSHRVGRNEIKENSFIYRNYKVAYVNSGDGIIIYDFERLGEPDPKKSPEVVTEEEKNKLRRTIEEYQLSPEIGGLKQPSYEMNSEEKKANRIIMFLMKTGFVAIGGIATVTYMEKFTSVKPIQLIGLYLNKAITAADLIMILEPLFMTKAYSAENGLNDEDLEKQINEAIGNRVVSFEELHGLWNKLRDPLVINIDGSGIQTLPLKEGVYFDLHNSGFKIKTGWVAPNTGLLVRGVEENSDEVSGENLFGDNTPLKNGEKAVNGFEALKDLDDNKDMIFDRQEAELYKIKIWFDLNSDGNIDEGELKDFSQVGLVSIDLNYSETHLTDNNGNVHRQTGTAKLEDGSPVDIVDIWFVHDIKNSKSRKKIKVSDEVKKMPQIRGFGKVHSLHQAIMRDQSEKLKNLIKAFIDENDEEKRKGKLHEIIKEWSKSDNRLQIIENFTGVKYRGGTNERINDFINNEVENFSKTAYEALMAQSHYRQLYRSFKAIKKGKNSLYNIKEVAFEMIKEMIADQKNGEKFLLDFIRNMKITRMINLVETNSFKKVFSDFGIRYRLMADVIDKNLYDVEGDKQITGTSGDDVFIIGKDGGMINGVSGDDTYYVDSNLGEIEISDEGGQNTLLLSDVTEEDVNVKIKETDENKINIEISFSGNTGKITILDYKIGESYLLVFDDKSSKELETFLPHVEISTKEELEKIQNKMDGRYRLTADIDLEGTEWKPIGKEYSKPFVGVFDGNGHTIRNLKVTDETKNHVGLFGVNSGQIKNLKMENVELNGATNIGSIVGTNRGEITACEVKTAKVKGNSYLGGLVGYNTGNISKSHVTEATMQGGGYIGGFVGYVYGGLVRECSVTGSVDMTLAGVYYGGFVGYNTGNISKCYSATKTRGNYQVGGFAGYNEKLIEKSISTGGVEGSRYVGGFVGRAYSNFKIENCLSMGNVSDVQYGGSFAGEIIGRNEIKNCLSMGIHMNGFKGEGNGTLVNSYFNKDGLIQIKHEEGGKTSEELRNISTYEGWDFETVWEMKEGSIPDLRGLPEVEEPIHEENRVNG